MNSIRTKITLLTVCTIIAALSIAAVIGVISIKKLGRNDADQMLHLTATTGAMNLESYFESVEHSVETVATLGVYIDARKEPNIEERFIRAEIAADRTNDDSQIMCGFYELD